MGASFIQEYDATVENNPVTCEKDCANFFINGSGYPTCMGRHWENCTRSRYFIKHGNGAYGYDLFEAKRASSTGSKGIKTAISLVFKAKIIAASLAFFVLYMNHVEWQDIIRTVLTVIAEAIARAYLMVLG